MQGPITSAVVADFWAQQGNVERALKRYRHAQRLATDPAAVQHDVRIIVDSNNLVGRVLEHVDVKRWLQQSTQLAAPFAKEDRLAFVQDFVALIPDASTKQDRRNNAQRLLTLYYELHGQTMLEQYLACRVQMLESRQRRIAEKKKKKQKKR